MLPSKNELSPLPDTEPGFATSDPSPRLTHPGHPSTHHSEQIHFRGFCQREVTLLVKRSEGIYDPIESFGGLKLLSSRWFDGQFRAQVDIQTQIPEPGSAPRELEFVLVDTASGVRFSNTLRCAIAPRDVWERPMGGFLLPATGFWSGPYLPLQGWGCRQGDPLKSVELELNGMRRPVCSLGLPSPALGASLPAIPEAESCLFAETLRREDFEPYLRIRAFLRFTSGQELIIEAPDVIWSEGLSTICGAVERVALGSLGRLEIEGWVFAPGFRVLRLELEGLLRRTTIENDPVLGQTVRWFSREDREYRFLGQALRRNYGFLIELNPAVLGRFPGRVSLLADGVKLGGVELSSSLTPRLEGFTNKALQRALRALSPLIRTRLAPTSEPAFVPGQKVLLAAHNMSDVEGAPKVLMGVAETLKEEICFLSAAGGGLLESFEKMGVGSVIPELSLSTPEWKTFGQGLERAGAIFSELAPCCVYANSLDAFWAVLLARHFDVPVLWSIHESVDPGFAKAGIDARIRAQLLEALDFCEHYIFVSEKTRELFRDFAGTSTVIPNGVDLRLFGGLSREEARERLGISQDDKVVSIVGTTTYRKGQDIFLRAMSKIRDESPRLFVVGAREGEYLEGLRDLSRALGLNTQFIFETPDVAPYFLASDVMVIASREESAPLVSLEAFAHGIPLVSTTVFGLSEQIRDGENALAANSEEEIAEKVSLLLSDPKLASRLATSAIADVKKRFSRSASLDAHKEAILRLIR